MKTVKSLIVATFVSSAVFAQTEIQTDNGDFESGTELKVGGKDQNFWKGEGFNIWAKPESKDLFDAANSGYVEGEGVDGSRALKIVTKKGEKPFDFLINLGPVDFASSGAGKYQISFKVKSLKEEKAPFWLVVKDENKENLGSGAAKNWKGMAEDWKEQTVEVEITEKSKTATLSFGLAKFDNTYWFDDFKVTKAE